MTDFLEKKPIDGQILPPTPEQVAAVRRKITAHVPDPDSRDVVLAMLGLDGVPT